MSIGIAFNLLIFRPFAGSWFNSIVLASEKPLLSEKYGKSIEKKETYNKTKHFEVIK